MQSEEIRVGNVNLKCFCCGRMIPGEPTKHPVEGQEQSFCGEDCHAFFLKYREIKSEQVIK